MMEQLLLLPPPQLGGQNRERLDIRANLGVNVITSIFGRL
jgi:hypothetical protein